MRAIAARAGTAYVDVRGDWAPFNRQLAQRRSSLSREAGKLGSSLGGQLSRGLSLGAKAGVAGVAGSLIYAAKKAGDFEQQMSTLGAVTDGNAKQMERFRKQALKAGADTKFSALDAAKAQTELAKGGLGVSKIMKGGLRSALALAAAGEMDLADAGETTVNVMKLFGLRGKDAMKIADGLATAANRTTADVSDFASAFKQGGSAAKTAGLDFKSTTAFLEALAEGGVKGSDAGTSMKAALVQLASPSAAAAEKAKQLGLSFFDAHGNMKDLADLSGHLRDKLGNLNRQQRLDAATTLVGTDGMRALLALYDAGPQKITRYERELGKQGTAADVAKKKQDNLKGSLEQLSGSAETLGIQVGTLMIPMIRRGADELTQFGNKVGKILNRKDLSIGEKLQRSLDLAKVEARPWVAKLKRALDEANIPDRLAAALSAATPVIANAAAKLAPKAAKAFIDGWMASSVWGRLAAGAWLVSKMGGPGTFRRIGSQAGAQVGAGMSGGVAASGLRGKLGGLFRGWGPFLALSVAATFGPELVKKLKEGGLRGQVDTSGSATVKTETGGAKKTIASASSLNDALRRVKGSADAMRAAVEKQPNLPPKTRDYYLQIADAVDKTAEPVQNVRNAIDRMAGGSSKSIQSLRTNVKLNTRAIKRALGDDSAAGKKAISENIQAAIRNVKASMREGKIATKAGTEEIERLMVAALQNMGFSKKQALSLRKAQKAGSAQTPTANGQLRPTQRGAYINEGKAHGDSVPALLERGEYVLNRKAVRKVGREKLDAINFGAAPRFQTGGPVGLQGGGSVTGDTDFLPDLMASLRRMSAAAGVPIFVQSGRRTVAEQLAQGPSTPGHPVAGPNGPHVRGVAADITPGFGTFGKLASRFGLGFTVMPQEPWHIQLLNAIGGAGGGGVAQTLRRLMVDGPASPLRSVVQGALDMSGAAAQSLLNQAFGSTANGSESAVAGGGSATGNGADLMRQISKQRGWSFADWWALDASETGHGANLSNPTSTARLRGQFLDMNYGDYGPGSDPAQNPSMAQQIESMAAYIAERYGNPSKAWAFHQAHNFYAKGGLVGMQNGGNPFNKGLHGGKFTHLPGGKKKKTSLGSVLDIVKTGKSPKVRKAAVDRMLKKIKSIGLPKRMQDQLKKYSGNSDAFGEFADRAGQLTVEPDENGAGGVLGKVGGKSQVQWLTAQRDALFQWRNAIIRAEAVVVARRETTAKLIERARARLATVRHNIAVADRTLKGPKGYEKELARLQKHPKRNRARIKTLKGLIGGVNKDQRGRGRVRDTLKDKLLPALTDKRTALNTARGDLLSNLDTVQGVGSPMTVFPSLPAVGVLGGSIFETQMRLSELNAPKSTVTDNTTAEKDTTGADALAQLLADANKRTAVSQAQYDVFKNMPPYGGSFATGGVVPGPVGAARTIVAHGGEVITPTDQGSPRVRVVMEDHRTRVFVDDVEQIVQQVNRRTARAGARMLPGRSGGGLG